LDILRRNKFIVRVVQNSYIIPEISYLVLIAALQNVVEFNQIFRKN